jgi:hypothetical protein
MIRSSASVKSLRRTSPWRTSFSLYRSATARECPAGGATRLSQKQNLEDAFDKLQEMIDTIELPPKERNVRTDVAKGTKERWTLEKRQRSEVKARRSRRDDD